MSPHSHDIMRHLAENCRNSDAQHVGTDGRRMTSSGSTIANAENAKDTYDRIEANIDELKETVLKLKEVDGGGASPIKRSAAARLQRQHESQEHG